MRRRELARVLVGTLTLVLLAGCGAETEELQDWMERQRREVKPNVSPLSPPKKFEAQPYTSLQAIEPFSRDKLSVALKMEARQPNSMLDAELNRRKEPLEFFPMDSLKMVGILEQKGEVWGLIQDPDGTIHRVQAGNHAGENYGEIIRISEESIDFVEIIPDGLGAWIEREISLSIGGIGK